MTNYNELHAPCPMPLAPCPMPLAPCPLPHAPRSTLVSVFPVNEVRSQDKRDTI